MLESKSVTRTVQRDADRDQTGTEVRPHIHVPERLSIGAGLARPKRFKLDDP
jgi:hypothetical protein